MTRTRRAGVSGFRRAVTASRLGLGAAGGSGVLALTYWWLMSPYSQFLGPFPYRAAAGEPAVALTFDDGPNEPYTSQIADLLDERGVRATFFQVGRAVQRHPEVTSRLAATGHIIGHHSHTHRFTRYLRRASLDAEISQGLQAFAALGLRPALYRPPWLLRTPALGQVAQQHHLRLVSGQFCHPLEVMQPSARRIARSTLAKTRPGSIIIFHDGFDGHAGDRSNTVAAVKIVLDRLLADGYRFTTIDELLHIPAYTRPYQPVI